MPADLPYVFAYFVRKGYSKRLALVMALHCCDAEQKLMEMQ